MTGNSSCSDARAAYFGRPRASSTAGTVVRAADGRAVLVLESGDPIAAVAEAARLDPVRVPHDEVRVVARIPRDPRHASKIDYGALDANKNDRGTRRDA